MIVLITGDRNWSDEPRMLEILSELTNVTLFIHGNANGADKMGGKIAAQLGWPVKVVKAQWDKYGRAAGPIRNQEMLDMDPDIVVAFHNDLENSKGTAHMVGIAKKKGVKTVLIRSKE